MRKSFFMKKYLAVALVGLCLAGCSSHDTGDIQRTPAPADYSKLFHTKQPVYTELPEINELGSCDIFGVNLENADLTDDYEKLMLSRFDNHTVFPKKLPEGFVPEQVFEQGKEEIESCGVKEVHDMGYTGKGVGIAVIDQTLLVDHEDYKDSIKYYHESERIPDNCQAAMHGSAICSIIAGKHGVAPDADIYYVADDSTAIIEDWSFLAEDINQIIDVNKKLPEDKKIRIISISMGCLPNGGQNYEEYEKAVESAKKDGIFVLSVGTGESSGNFQDTNMSFMGASKIFGKTGIESYRITRWIEGDSPAITRELQNALWIPMDGFTTAANSGTEDYQYFGVGGMSWSTPYLAACYVLACEKNPDITFEEFYQIAKDSADSVVNTDGENEYELRHLLNMKKTIENCGE